MLMVIARDLDKTGPEEGAIDSIWRRQADEEFPVRFRLGKII